jgi:hypothetical protein
MNTKFFRRSAIAAAAAVCLAPGRASAQVLTSLGNLPYGNANVQAYFAADADSVHVTDPGTLPSWGSAGIGPYAGNSVPGVPGPPAAPIYGNQLAPSNSFYGGPYTSSFTDGGSPPTTATSTISESLPGGTSVASANVLTSFTLNEPNNPPGGYAYEQIDFAADYGTYGVLTGGIGGAPSFSVSGFNTGTGSYAQFAGVVNYWWAPSDTTYTPAASFTGPFSLLGSLNYSWSSGGPGTFSATVAPTGSLLATPIGSGPGVLELIGDFYVAGDPSEINVEPVPEPSTWLLLAVALVPLGIWQFRRRCDGRLPRLRVGGG